jgi:hypothetical protein
MDTRDYFNRKTLIGLTKEYELQMLEYEFKQSNYEKNAEMFSDIQKKIQKLYVMKQKNIAEISKMDIEIFKSNHNIK